MRRVKGEEAQIELGSNGNQWSCWLVLREKGEGNWSVVIEAETSTKERYTYFPTKENIIEAASIFHRLAIQSINEYIQDSRDLSSGNLDRFLIR